MEAMSPHEILRACVKDVATDTGMIVLEKAHLEGRCTNVRPSVPAQSCLDAGSRCRLQQFYRGTGGDMDLLALSRLVQMRCMR